MKKKRIFISFLLLVAGGSFFALGMLIAEMKMRFTDRPKKELVTMEGNVSEKVAEAVRPDDHDTNDDGNGGSVTGDDLSETQDRSVQQVDASEQATGNVADADKFSFAILGDTQRFNVGNAGGGFQQAIRQINRSGAGLVIAMGDLVSGCHDDCEDEFSSWKNQLGSLSGKTYATMGNHDRLGRNVSDEDWQKVFNYPTNGPEGYKEMAYSFNFKNTHFIALDSQKPKDHVINKAQRDWLERDLSANNKENIFVYFHEPAYPVSSKIGESLDAEPGERNDLWKIFEKYHVTAVFSGHEHIHSRKKIGGVYQFIFGNTDSFDHDMPAAGMAEYAYRGQNYGLVEVEGKNITVHVYSTGGKELNSFKFSH